MTGKPETLEPERQPRARQRAMSIRVFCQIFGIGRTKVYQEIREGRLTARKSGARTIISSDDAERWLTALPTVQKALERAAPSAAQGTEYRHPKSIGGA
jgi:excisionase family DNA binding protein